MFRELRRIKQKLSRENCIEIMQKSCTGILSVIGDMGYPYSVPLNFVYIDDALYIHCAREGHKIDAIRNNDKVSFCIVSEDKIKSAEFSTEYKSVIVFGRAEIIEDNENVLNILNSLVEKYSADFKEQSKEEIDKFINITSVIKIIPEHISGKESK